MSELKETNSLLEKILLAFQPKQAEVKLGSMMLADGSVKIEWDGEMLEAGVSCWITAEDGTTVPVPAGEYPLEDGTTLVVTEDGIVGEVKAMAEETAPVAAAEPDAGKVSNDAQIAQEIESAIKSILIKYSEMETKVNALESKNVELSNQLAELSKEPAAKPIKSAPVQVDLSKMTAKERIFNTLKKVN